MNDYDWMRVALQEAAAAEAAGDVPVGAVLVDSDGNVLARDHNRREVLNDPTAHAEILVMRAAASRLGGWRLTGTTLFVTLEPCVMCAGAIVASRVGRVVFATRDPKGGAAGSLYHVLQDDRLNHRVDVSEGVMAEEAQMALRQFFRQRRRMEGEPGE